MSKTAKPGLKPPADLWARLDEAEAQLLGCETPGIPMDAFTLAEYCDHRAACAPGTAQGRVAKMVARGVLKTGHRYGRRRDGKRLLLRVYWPA